MTSSASALRAWLVAMPTNELVVNRGRRPYFPHEDRLAKVSRLTEFATLDTDQKKLAVAAGLTLADLPE